MDTQTHADQLDWQRIDWVLLDMDGTILDLAFDNYFWRELVPQRYAEARNLSLADAEAELHPKFRAVQHTLPWYCTDYWSEVTGLDMAALKRDIRERIRPMPGAVAFIDAVRRSGRALWIATNAHRDSWQLKLEHTGLRERFDRVVSSHDFGYPKEDLRFWDALQRKFPFDPARTLFVDDSMPVLSAAQAWGIAQVVGIRRPDSGHPGRPIPAIPSVETLSELTAGVPRAAD